MTDMSDTYREALCCRAVGIGLIPISVITRLTPDEWAVIRVMSQSDARKLVAIHNTEPVTTVRAAQRLTTEAETVVKKVGHER